MDNTAQEVGTLLLNMALDAPPPATVPDALPPVAGPLDAAYAALVSAINSDDQLNDAACKAMWQARQTLTSQAILEKL
ncbi:MULTISPECIES: hypothetical protein [Mycobacterium]|uniref:HNH endonuclease n=1 Tax=Mycobacterium paragordonae TaxID=1389713 RepID=A0ABQ1CG34_9MYCO|nr:MULTISPECIES: hypothetical protein [Mycobacterium]QNI09748.1 hypothetical protein GAN17_25460 [Mycobacterium kubicae]QNI15247.1 hypothetical protein GAN18_29130 [Mycobacterium kubicae]GFG83210.1 hypothetical protein MPRG_64860 [Mycobacterium paragordonae]